MDAKPAKIRNKHNAVPKFRDLLQVATTKKPIWLAPNPWRGTIRGWSDFFCNFRKKVILLITIHPSSSAMSQQRCWISRVGIKSNSFYKQTGFQWYRKYVENNWKRNYKPIKIKPLQWAQSKIPLQGLGVCFPNTI